MNNNTFSKTLAKTFAVIGSFSTALFGKINWNSPPWLTFLRKKSQTRPKLFWGSAGAFILLVITGHLTYDWYKNLPQPTLVTASITAPRITPIAEKLVPDVLTIDFGTANGYGVIPLSVAPLKEINKKVTEGIEISPAMKGTWLWTSSSQLVFTPENDWPAGQTYQVHFAREFFTENTNIKTLTYSFSTQAFEAKIEEFKFYQDPVNPKKREAVATITFNFPVNPASLAKFIRLNTEALKNQDLNFDAKPFQFTLTYDEHKRTAYLHSENLTIPSVPRYMLLTIDKGVKSASDTADTQVSVSKNLLIPDMSSYFKVNKVEASIIRNEQDRPEQVLTLDTSLGITEKQLNKSLHVYLLPTNYPASKTATEKPDYGWQNPGEVTADILALSSPLPLQTIPADRNYATLHSYKFHTQTPRYIYLKLDKGTQGFGDFVLTNDYVAVIKVPEFPKEIGFLHQGALMALSSEKKLSVLVRGLPAVKFEIARVLPDNINQLVTQTGGDFNNPYFYNDSFNAQNISEISSEIQQFDNSDITKQQYTALDLAKYLAVPSNTGGVQGLYLLQAQAWDVKNKIAMDTKASRLVLITNLGLLVKDNQEGSHEVFVQSIIQGSPVANIEVTVLGKNGLPLITRTTNEQGQASFPSLKDFIEDREPTVYLARAGQDVSFIPYNNSTRQLNFSRYDIGGIYSNNPDLHNLSAYLFSDRGIYRPGDTMHIAMIVKQAYAASQPAGLPLQATITDPRGNIISDTKYTLDASGYLSMDFVTNAASPTGQYFITLYTVKDEHTDSYLGSLAVHVGEFQPDRMRITAKLSEKATPGWISPNDLKARIGLWNLYGAPAAYRRISAKMVLAPQRFYFDKYPDTIFADPLLSPEKPAKVFTDTFTDTKTDNKGEAEFDLNLNRFDQATYHLSLYAEGFEAEGGRSVTALSSALVSPLTYLVGYKPDGDLTYIKQKSARSIHFMAINPQLNQQALSNLKIQLLSTHPVTTLVKKTDGTYQYQSLIKTSVINTTPFTISETGEVYPLPTDKIGDFALKVLDQNNVELSRVKFSVVGASQAPLAKNAELSIKLNKSEYRAGEDIELQIIAPYTGAGLITIERDKVYATQWFKTDTTNSVQTIHIPEDFQANGYVNVAFVRDWNSPDIFTTPLSYNIVPFTVNNEKQTVHIELETPALARPGETFTINYKSDKPGKIIVFAIDEGILQVSNYKTPAPLAFFFQKRALEVTTQQTVDQILPNYIKARELSSVGGDGGEALLANHLNPFKRKTDLPVVYWSGIVDTDTNTRQLSYPVPDYFNGTLRVMAVAVADNAVGSTEKKSEIRGNFVINPNLPTFVAPGDEFEITASVANNVKDSGVNAKTRVQLKASPELEIIGSSLQTLTISEKQEKTVRFKLRAKALLGSAQLNFIASQADKSSTMKTTLSVRPATPFMTSLNTGIAKEASKTLPIDNLLYPEYRKVEAAVSTNPIILVAGLQRYLDNFPYGCTEQIVSKALPLLAMAKEPGYSQDADVVRDKIKATIQMLSLRQMSSGAFSYWPGYGENSANAFGTLYAMQFLTEAREQGYSVPNNVLFAGIAYLKELASQNVLSQDQARLQAYAIYILTRNEIVTTNYLTNLQWYLEQDKMNSWQQNLTGAYIAASYKLLKNDAEAERLIARYKPQNDTESNRSDYSDFYDTTLSDAQYLYLLAHHFPDNLSAVGNKLILSLVAAMNSNEINTLLSGYTSLALGAYGASNKAAATNQTAENRNFSISETFTDKKQKTLATTDSAYEKVAVDNGVTNITVANPGKQTYFYQVTLSGFDTSLPTGSLKQGLEIYREYHPQHDNSPITSTELGNEIEVHIQVRSLDNRYLNNIAIVDLLPGGFEVVTDSVSLAKVDYVDAREDRVIFFTSLSPEAKEIVYRIKAINTGKFIVPPVYAESMYDPAVKARSEAATITVTEVP